MNDYGLLYQKLVEERLRISVIVNTPQTSFENPVNCTAIYSNNKILFDYGNTGNIVYTIDLEKGYTFFETECEKLGLEIYQ